MSVVILQYENRSNPLFEELMARNVAYAARHDYLYVRPTQEFDLPPWWIKVFLVQTIMKTQPDVKYIAWLDSDAVIHNQSKPITALFKEKTGSPDFLLSYCNWHTMPTTANVGVFYIRVNEHSRAAVDRWAACYNPERWSRDARGKWKTPGVWAGDDYEQGALNSFVIPAFPTRFEIAMPHVYDCWETYPPNITFSCHFCTSNKNASIYAYLMARKLPELAFWGAVGAATVAYAAARA